MSNQYGLDHQDRHRGQDVSLRVGGSMTGVGIGAGVLYLSGLDRATTGYVSAVLLVVGIAILVVGYGARRKNRR
jgi:hypothetical protein